MCNSAAIVGGHQIADTEPSDNIARDLRCWSQATTHFLMDYSHSKYVLLKGRV
jgi:hypothetical protein